MKRWSRRSLRVHRGTSGVFLAGRLVPPADVAGLAEEVLAQGVAPILRRLRRQGCPTALRRSRGGAEAAAEPRAASHAGRRTIAPCFLPNPTSCPTPTAGALRRHQDSPTCVLPSLCPPGPYLAAVAALMEAASQALDLVGVLVLTGDDGELAGTAHRGVFPWWDKGGVRRASGGWLGPAKSPHPGLLSYL